MKILLVDDDPQIVELIRNRLKQDNYSVDVIENGSYALDLLNVSSYSLILLDVVLPNTSGIEVCQALRLKGNTTPILMLTGQDETHDKIMGLDAGADGYLVKPFELDELAARVRALLRRTTTEAGALLVSYGSLHFNPSTQQLTFDDQGIVLRPKELAILELMMRHPTRIFSPDTLLDQLWTLEDCPNKDTVKAHIGSLRKQLKRAGVGNIIETLYGRGYRLKSDIVIDTDLDRGTDAEPDANLDTNLDAKSDANLDTNLDREIETLKQNQPKCKNPDAPERSETEPLSCQSPLVVQTWNQVQAISWQRLLRLKSLVPDHCLEAMKIAHQLKGTLGTFGFKMASLQAKRVEQLLSVEINQESSNEALIWAEIQTLEAEIQRHIDLSLCSPHPMSTQPTSQSLHPSDESLLSLTADPSLGRNTQSHVVIVCRDRPWAEALQSLATQARHLSICSPATLNTILVDHSPALIVIECAVATQKTDLGLVNVLSRNYEHQSPIVAVVEPEDLQGAVLALEKGAKAIAFKHWAPKTLSAIFDEYLP